VFENDVMPAGADANGYKSATFHVSGTDNPLHNDLKKICVFKGAWGR
jgi:branched-chain amino acid transport system substrate-binding protein